MSPPSEPVAQVQAAGLAQSMGDRFLAALVTSNDDVIIGLALDGAILSWNAGAEKLYGYGAAEVIGQSLSVIVPQARAGEIPAILARLSRGERVERYGTERRRKDGSVVIVSASYSLVRDASGAVIGACAIHRDVSDLVEDIAARERLAESATLPNGEAFFSALARYLCDALDVEYVFISTPAGPRLLAVVYGEGGEPLSSVTLAEEGSPCEGAMGHGRLVIASGLASAYPAHALVAELGLESYAGVALRDEGGAPIGVVAIAGRTPLRNPEFVLAVLELVAPRVEVELRQRHARRALAESEDRYRQLVEMSPDMILVHSNGRLVFANATAARLLGASGPEALIGLPLGDIAPVWELPAAQACCANYFPCRNGPPGGYVLQRLDGLPLDVTTVAAPITFEGQPACMVIVRDVTEQRRIATSLSEAQQLARIGSFEWNLLTDTHWWSDELYRLLGLEPDGQPPTMARGLLAIDAFDRPAVEAAILAATRDIRPFRVEFMVANGDGGARRLEARGHVATDERGRPVRVVGTAQDVSEARRSAQALQASEARFRSVVATAGEGIVLANQDGDIILWNPGASRLFGYDMTETLGRPLTMLMPERFRQAHERGMGVAARQGPPVHRKPIELVALHKDGREFPIELSLTSWEADGERYFTGLVRDISERRALEQMKDSFIAMISHELRTPLNTITCSLDLLSTGAVGQLSEKAARILEIAQSNTDRLARIVGDILDLQVLKQGRVSIVRAPCDVEKVVLDAVHTTAPMAERRAVTLETALALPPGFSLDADADRLHQTLVNLLVNAVRYSPSGSRVVVSVHLAHGEVRFLVDDEGPGIPPEEREIAFERFFLGAPPPEGQAPGTGLGLPLCQAIVQQHGGRIWIEDGPRGGAAVLFALPARP